MIRWSYSYCLVQEFVATHDTYIFSYIQIHLIFQIILNGSKRRSMIELNAQKWAL